MRPSVSRVVHYVSYGTPGGEYSQACRAAVVTAVQMGGGTILPETVSLCVMNPSGVFFDQDVRYHEGEPLKPGESRRDLCGGRDYAGGTWHWPAREPE